MRQLYPDGLTILDDGRGNISAFSAPARQTIDEFTATPGQIEFTLKHRPIGQLLMYVNGALQLQGRDFVLSGGTATWLNNGFTLGSSDDVTFVYPW